MANNVRAWSTTAASNGTADADINASEGCPPSSVNDAERQMMAKIKNTMITAEYLDHGYTATFASATTFASPGDLTAVYLSRRRLMFSDATTTYGTIVSSSFVASNTTVTVVMDSSVTLTSALTAVSIGAQAPTNLSAPANFNKEAYATTAGTSTAYTAAFTPKNVALTNGVHVRVKLDQTCGATPTLAVDGLTAKTIVKPGNVAVSAGDLTANSVLSLTYDSTLDKWVLNGAPAGVGAASESAAGIVELATTAEAAAGTDTSRAVTPAGVVAALGTFLVKTTTYTAVSGNRILADTTGGAWSLTMPASPSAGDSFELMTYGSSLLTILRNSSKIAGIADDGAILGGTNAHLRFVYLNATYGWVYGGAP